MVTRALRIIATLAIWAACIFAAPRPIVLITDCGADMDDQWALAHLVLSPEFDVRAVVTTHTGQYPILAAPAAETSARIAREVLDHIPSRSRPVVLAGSSVPLRSRIAIRNAGVERILAESRNFNRQHRLTVIIIGAATDTASALLAEPAVAQRIEIVAMGFSGWPQGGDSFNVRNDPIAWQVILDSEVPVAIGDGSVTRRDLGLTSERAHALLDGTGNAGGYLAGLLDDWLAKQRSIVLQTTGDAKLWPVWDEVTVAYLLGMTKSERHDRPKLGADLKLDHSAKMGAITWITAIDASRLWTDLANRLRQARRSEQNAVAVSFGFVQITLRASRRTPSRVTP